jgi:flagella basal body P-ring formation protein FlgA
MSNVVIAAKRFFQNKNVVTLIGVVVIVLILYFLYNYEIQTQVQPQNVPVAKEIIQPGTEITADMIKWIKVPAAAVSSNVVKTNSNIVGKYTNYNTEIPEGSMF